MAVPHAPSYYAATANPAPVRAPLDGDARCDVCVVGAGFTGLSAALELAARGLDVVVLEAARVGWAASGRNGGQIIMGWNPSMARIARWVGRADARRLWDVAEEGRRLVGERVAAQGIACDLRWGYLTVGERAKHRRALADALDEAKAHGYEPEMRLFDREEVQARVASPRYTSALWDAGSGHLHPLNYALGLAEAAAAAGARLHEGTAVRAIDDSAPLRVRTERGTVAADHVVLACNAEVGALSAALGRHVMPVGTWICATEPLSEERMEHTIAGGAAVCDANFVLNYYRFSADRRLIFGGRASYTARPPADPAGTMRRAMLRVFPQLADLRIDYAWGGNVAITPERTPHLGRLADAGPRARIWFAHGFSGHGVALTGVAGRILGEAVAGDSGRLDLMARLPHTPFPGGALLRTPLLVAAMAWYRLRDML